MGGLKDILRNFDTGECLKTNFSKQIHFHCISTLPPRNSPPLVPPQGMLSHATKQGLGLFLLSIATPKDIITTPLLSMGLLLICPGKSVLTLTWDGVAPLQTMCLRFFFLPLLPFQDILFFSNSFRSKGGPFHCVRSCRHTL